MTTAKYLILDYLLYVSLYQYVQKNNIHYINYCFTYATHDSQFNGMNIIPYISLLAERKKLANALCNISDVHCNNENLVIIFNTNSSQQKLLAYEICYFAKQNNIENIENKISILDINDLPREPAYQSTDLYYKDIYLQLETLRKRNISDKEIKRIAHSIENIYINGNIVIHYNRELRSIPINIIDNYILSSLSPNYESILLLTANVISRLLSDGYEGVGDLVIMSRIHYLSSIKAAHYNAKLTKVNAFNLLVKSINN
ncbi:hypothetical protein PEC311524_06430 [Pectobacterium carotovorum subsp. carotovorum]|nr:hypothetical protein PEC311524_06430 [Pectobacterium carotovorum subsp. carotovorum]